MSPTLPRYNSQEKISTQQPAPFRQGSAEEIGAMVNPIVETADTINQKWSAANDTMQFAEKQASHQTALEDIQNRASLDPDPKAFDKYAKEIDKVTDENSTGFTNKLIEQKAAIDFKSLSSSTKIKIDNDFKKKQIAVGIINYDNSVQSLVKRRVSAISDQEAHNVDLALQNLSSEYIAKSIISPEYAEKSRLNSKESVMNAMIFNDPKSALSVLNDKEGYFSDMPLDKIIKAKDSAQKEIKSKKEVTEYNDKLAMNENETNVLLAVANGADATSMNLERDFLDKRVSSEFLAAFNLYKLSPGSKVNSVNYKSDKEKQDLARTMSEIFNATDKEKMNKALQTLLSGGTDGKIAKNDLFLLIQAAGKRAKNLALTSKNPGVAYEGKEQDKQKYEDAAFNSLLSWGNQNYVPNMPEVITHFARQIVDGVDPVTAKDSAITQAIHKISPESVGMVSPPNMIISRDKKTRYFITGQSKEVGNKVYNPSTGGLDVNPKYKGNKPE